MKTLILLLICLLALNVSAQDRPNILVLMFEDTSADNLSAFGNTVIKTPNFDALAAKGIKFTNAYSNGPQCSTARSTFIRGMYGTTVGATWHRKDVMTPDEFYFPRTLQKNGYNTYLKGKHDFNTAIGTWGPNGLKIFDGLWYKDCPADIPFYGQYNFFDTHMSKITDSRKPGERDNRTVYASDVDDASIEPYLPPTEWVVDDYAYHLHRVKQFDNWLKNELATLEATGRADNTIIFV
ncbi:sulfatase-like hydrolase/transferase, partial [bacterium]|nr:sulfatase-like hydrolase/transferase [bacterium]